jgi:hypothetical protein
MAWLQHVFAVWILAHMLWAAVLLEKEWRRIRRLAGSPDRKGLEAMPGTLVGAKTPQATTRP